MPTVAQELTDLVQLAAQAAGYGDSPVPLEACVRTNNPKFGDYQSNFAFRLGRELRTNPRAVAQAIVDALPPSDIVASAEIAGPGFVNFRLSDAWVATQLATRPFAADLGGGQPGAGRTLVIDYSSPNAAKRMHVGHLRSTIIGDAIRRIYQHLGWRVIADNHIGDWGTQFGMLVYAWRAWADEAAYDADPVGELQRIYQKFKAASDLDPLLRDRAKEETARLQAGDRDNRALWRKFIDASLAEYDGLYSRLGVHFDVAHGESFYHDRLQPLVDHLAARGLAVESDGAMVFPFDEEDGRGLSDRPLVIRKSDGAFVYGTTDLATVQHRIETWDPDLVCYVTDVRQAQHFRQVFAACKKMGIDLDLVHVGFGMLRFADGAVASTREGQTLNLVDVLDTAADRARAVVDANSPEIPDAERAAIAEAVGAGAVKYADLSQNPQTDITFDWDKMLAMEGNTAPYLMYARARCLSIFRRGEVTDFTPGGVDLGEATERALAVALLATPEVVELAAATWRPNIVAEHLFSVAQAYARFHAACPVLKSEPAVRQSRLTLCAATAEVLGLGLGLLGLQPLDRM